MQLTYILELLKPTKRKENIFLNNIVEVVKNRQAIAAKLKTGEINLSSADFKEVNLPSLSLHYKRKVGPALGHRDRRCC
ncbi:hypothetical protein [Halanaerobium praevalens]|uniref:Uncharacterized protein n=1 Tax=Halanaerobium praevalens (strain ATCC 33744 / DSM 2228 / GSL) TaxID=572479 RepID=E3DRQ2_HALPG|nr:hypothetical protein [Halanaerobium praevalens]ADO78116.1 hypothetical protein Hprae_1992 [Halanaerobium praevalens DSM 2228]